MRSRFIVSLVVVTLVFTFAFAFAAGAQEETSQQPLEFAEGEQTAQAERQAATLSGPLQGTKVQTFSTDGDIFVEIIIIPGPTCVAKKGASFVLQDEDGTQADFIDAAGENVRIQEVRKGLRVVARPVGPDADIEPLNQRGRDRILDTGGLVVVTSTGIRCEGGGSTEGDGSNGGDDSNGGGGSNGGEGSNGGSSLNDDGSDGGDSASDRQYGTDDGNADGAEITGATDTEEDVIVETISENSLPNTGGVPLSGSVVSGTFLVGAGLLLLRSTIRRGT